MDNKSASNSFQVFLEEAPKHSKALLIAPDAFDEV